ncbi:hypothetical protein F941_00202 [Acinetobacter bouvetii DSM 14964 = CIP 107468]|jgi:hypothetical protein|uniref:Type I restriction modification DNA specificity domain-containing protein n=1 Tax=Acinetobacter bouvetii DSM 14964 = CIP 107468 TaxID=1120925 RepID=N9DUF5_9GAMM|nr:restriction endonuclease subunit S [Acinetobacter bouvetii]ENV84285.1 hypothetical protein F941_00202 [Acinetobacter bouvetii DSM 14964 = CIP 107468]BCU66132.1 type II restriction enzyme [Acinetobacter bouvetii]
MLDDVEWGEYQLKDLFSIVGTKSLDSNAVNFRKSGINFVGRTFSDNGIQGKIEKQSFEPNEPFTITATVIGNYKYVKFQTQPYYCSQNINKLSPKEVVSKWNKNTAYFFISYIQKFVSTFDGQQGGYKLEDIKNHKIQLPVRNGEIDFNFMEKLIGVLEQGYMQKINTYLRDTGLNDYTLTDKEREILEHFEDWQWGEFKISSLFEKLSPKNKNKKFDKKDDTSMVQTTEFNLPLVNAKVGDNGIMFYGREGDFDSAEMVLDVISNGAIATGRVYAQPHKVGVLWDAYLLKVKEQMMTKQKLLCLATCLEKSIKLKFGWDNKAVWTKVQYEKILLPINNGQPDYVLMQTLISAIQKLVIRDVVSYVVKTE